MKTGQKDTTSYTGKINGVYIDQLNGVYIARLHMEMFIIHSKCTVAKTVQKVYRAH